ncbi:uncharacterized protein LOC120797899 isoform X2 [Xiphias gladius]|uniref:uncharacterized protein LOC120797899 isoform X2 n=1 Tax=Xiphias gladius TaxID=8245 RepID=UPI001A998AAE|nr:uncharacterized protein LOC120797899 isoform X2 [Xiphias gladius]
METDSWYESRTVVVSGVPDLLPASRMVDKLTIHFQSRRRSHGGDVEVVRYPTNMEGVACVTFDKAEDAEEVVRKEQQLMTDDKFPEEYLLTVFPFTRDVFCMYVRSAKVDLSLFGGDQASLIQSLRSDHRSLRFQPLLRQRKAIIEGPFAAVQALREDLIRRAGQLKSTVSAPTASAGLRESVLNPRVVSHPKFASSVSCSGSNAKRGPAGSSCSSKALQSTGEAARVLLSNAKTQNTPWRQKVSSTVGSFSDTDSDKEEKPGGRSTLKMTTEYRTKRAKASPRQVFREEISAGIGSSLSGLDLVPAEKISANHPGVDDTSQNQTRPDRVSATEIRGENPLGSRHNNTDSLQESDQSSSAATVTLLHARLNDVSTFSQGNAEDTEEDPEDPCIWVDSYTFRYIEKFDKKEFDRCLKGLKVSVECVEGTNLTQILLTEKRTSETASRIRQALKNLKTLVERWMSILRVHQICYDGEKQPQKQKLIQICNDVNFMFDDVLYMFEDSCIKVVGPSVSSHRFYRRVEDRLNSKTFL